VIIPIAGIPGSCKSYTAVAAALLRLRKGKAVVANLAITDPVTGNKSEPWDPIEEGFGPLRARRETLIICDEAGANIGARDWQKRATRGFLSELAQIRRRANGFILTAHSLDDVDVWVRRQMEQVCLCSVAVRHPWEQDPSGWEDPMTGRVRHRAWFMRQIWVAPRDATLAADTIAHRKLGVRLVHLRKEVFDAWDSYADVGTGYAGQSSNGVEAMGDAGLARVDGDGPLGRGDSGVARGGLVTHGEGPVGIPAGVAGGAGGGVV